MQVFEDVIMKIRCGRVILDYLGNMLVYLGSSSFWYNSCLEQKLTLSVLLIFIYVYIEGGK